MIIIMHGDICDGMEFIGPFETDEDAMNYGCNVIRGEAWKVILVDPPEGATHTRDGRKLTDTERHQVAASLKSERPEPDLGWIPRPW